VGGLEKRRRRLPRTVDEAHSKWWIKWLLWASAMPTKPPELPYEEE